MAGGWHCCDIDLSVSLLYRFWMFQWYCDGPRRLPLPSTDYGVRTRQAVGHYTFHELK